ncbi:hypothetical protein DFR46_0840 [Parasphingopyxis lamellibrachiae]|uniref:Uncharacterized protein n=2 Tax=Parasphingopyxis lamellibrachiae TaxID=680125 RepID=A0A3D9FDJ8_9SPHN|nr:hypothetical protein DFR46_0840 [Parasphingopyxis lamellibrachiae]
MGEEKFASLSSGLLARKGAAKPAMRRQGFINPEGNVTDDLGWNDMGLETPHPVNGDGDYHGEAPLPEVRKQQEQLAEGLGDADYTPFEPAEAQTFAVPGEEPEPQDEPTHTTNGHGGLSPMEPSDAEPEPVAEIDEQIEEPAPAVEAEHGLRAHGESPLSVKKADRIEPVEQNETAESHEPKEQDVPARQKVAFTLRLDKERHLKLRLASAVLNQSAQRLVTEALDQFLEQHPDVQALTGPLSAANKH